MRENLKIKIPSQGWKQFLTARKEMLDALDRARQMARAHEVETYHGRVAEAEFRNWLTDFLPKRYGVTPGYIISPGIQSTERAPHFDVIIYDQLESPVLWIEESPDTSPQGRSLAIPVEHVRAVLEIKSSFSPATVGQVVEHLGHLSPLMAGPDDPNERYKLHLPRTFQCGMVFFDLKKEFEFAEAALKRIISCVQFRGFFGGFILRAEGNTEELSGRISVLRSESPMESTIGRGKTSLLRGLSTSQSVKVAENFYLGSMLLWSEIAFAQFAFDLIAMMQGTYEVGRLSSFYGIGTSRLEQKEEAKKKAE